VGSYSICSEYVVPEFEGPVATLVASVEGQVGDFNEKVGRLEADRKMARREGVCESDDLPEDKGARETLLAEDFMSRKWCRIVWAQW
jgi:hypothetical protein